ncbi:MAG: cytochrome c3 family protein, partial [Candidatus Marinimicrobia bacterium]|nr:cytochrome c3 family protein [Candidatus Neomarinimicrobiota bacterium]
KNESTNDLFTSNKNHNVMLSAGSLKCLSCHDGATATNTLPNGFADFTITLAMRESNSNSNINATFNDRNYNSQGIGNNHPVGIVYDETKAGLNAIADLKIAKLEKGTNKITCASCHEPHGKTNASYLTVSNVGSSLCLDCHNK